MGKAISITIFINCVLVSYIANAGDSFCRSFYNELSQVPHTRLEIGTNGFISIWNKKFINGCEVVFESNESLVSGGIIFQKFDSFINRPGWKFDNQKCADGPGSSIVGIENDNYACIVFWEQQAWIDDNSQFKQSDDSKLIVQCSAK